MLPPTTPASGPLMICFDHMPALRSSFLAPVMASPPSELVSVVRSINAQGSTFGVPDPPRYIEMQRDGYSVDNVFMVTAETERQKPFSVGLFGPRGHNHHIKVPSLLFHDDFRLKGEITLRAGFDVWSDLFPDGASVEERRIWLLGHSVEYFLLFKRLMDEQTAAVFMAAKEYLMSH